MPGDDSMPVAQPTRATVPVAVASAVFKVAASIGAQVVPR